MSFTCGLIGLPGVGKTTIFNAITAAGAEGFGRDDANRAVVTVPDSRIAPLAAMYNTTKTVPAQMEVVDIPGLKAGETLASQVIVSAAGRDEAISLTGINPT
ncbi:MAG: 50S ribosome-binding GTPase, partial [Planctomycetota bacterium]|nr:50S ribosome-binding GTPase [Planctomycetota bacterium]